MIGERLSNYEILEELGRGGMGIVYKARDTNLDRTVAIKVLPAGALASEMERTRFYREAKAAAQLHHPHIASIFQIDEAVASGAPHGSPASPFIAMEFIDGESLHERISRGPFKLRDAVRIASQIATGLKDAHDQNIVHRDIKSGNVMLSSKGEAKILDFGLAQTVASTKLTREGTTLGTVAYMSPEQARGEEVDGRTDIWSLGVILYEMITGLHPFPGDYEQAVIYEILNQDPEPPTALRTGVPMELERITMKCLSKDQEIRYQSAAELIADLKGLDVRGSGSATRTTGPVPVTQAAPSSRSRTLPAIATVFVGVIAAVLGWVLKPGQQQDVRYHFEGPIGYQPGWVSPDGQKIAYHEGPNLMVRRFSESSPERFLAENEAGFRLEGWSPDSEELLFAHRAGMGRWRLRALNTVNGEERLVFQPEEWGIRKAIWPKSDEIILLTSSGLFQTNRDGTSLVQLDMPGDHALLRQGALISLPDGTFLYPNVGEDGYTGLSYGQGEARREVLPGIGAHIENGTYADTGHLLFTREIDETDQHAIWIVEFDLDQKTAIGEPQIFQILARNPVYSSATGTLSYSRLNPIPRYELVVTDLKGQRVSDYAFSNIYITAPAVSTDGRYIAASVIDSPGTKDIWVYDMQTGRESRITSGFTNAWAPYWSPDGSRLVFQSRPPQTGKAQLFLIDRDGRSEPELVIDTEYSTCCPAWAPDGQRLVFRNETTGDMWSIDLTTGESGPVLEAGFALRPYRFSPDGKYLVYISGRTGVTEIVVTDYPNATEIHPVSTGGADEGRWVGNRIIYGDRNNTLQAATVNTSPVLEIGAPELFFSGAVVETDLANGSTVQFDIMPDGEHVVIAQPQGRDESRLVVVHNARRLIEERF